MCDRPLKGFKTGLTKNNRPNYLVCSPDVNYIWCDDRGRWHRAYDNMDSNRFDHGDIVKDYTLIPCGSCLSCRITRAAEMANRCMLERSYHNEACFVTLTYDDEHLITTNYTNVSTGETGVSNTLFKKHYQDFIKRLRKKFPDSNIRYLLCGEYGEVTQRAHYHAILFGYWPSDAVQYSVNKRGQPLYISNELEKIWKNGYVIIGDCTRDTCNYVSRYVTKKLYSDLGEEEYQKKGRIPPFIVSSKRPAIGLKWYEDNKDWCFNHQISYSTPEGGISFNAPRYFHKRKWIDMKDNIDLLLSKEVQDELDLQDKRNDVMKNQFEHEKDYNGLRRSEIGEAKERERKSKAKAFKRDCI